MQLDPDQTLRFFLHCYRIRQAPFGKKFFPTEWVRVTGNGLQQCYAFLFVAPGFPGRFKWGYSTALSVLITCYFLSLAALSGLA